MEHPILFSGSMVKAILEGRKTQTRRVMNPQPIYDPQATEHYHSFGDKKGAWVWTPKEKTHWFYWDGWNGFDSRISINCPYGREGDELWVRETWTYITKAWNEHFDAIRPDSITPNGCPVDLLYRADGYEIPARWTPSIFMPRWASRLTLEVVRVRTERLQNINYLDCIAEGIQDWTFDIDGHQVKKTVHQLRSDYWRLWDSINGKRPGCAWRDNPWVWVLGFERKSCHALPNNPLQPNGYPSVF